MRGECEDRERKDHHAARCSSLAGESCRWCWNKKTKQKQSERRCGVGREREEGFCGKSRMKRQDDAADAGTWDGGD